MDIEHPKTKGIITEYKVISKLLELGYPVSKPVGDNLPYDIIIDIDGKLYTVQIKTGRYDNGCIVFNAFSSRNNMSKVYVKTYLGQVDYFITWYEKELFFMIAVEDSPHTTIRFRVEPTKNNQEAGVVWAKDYILEDVLMSIRNGNILMNGG